MTVMHATSPDAAAGLVVTGSVEGLETLRREDCPGVLWQRPLDERLLNWIDALAPEQLPDTRQILHCEDVRRAVLTVCDKIEPPGGDELSLLVQDITDLAAAFNRVVSASYLRLRLSVVTNNSCRRFHTDNVVARLICTYRGTGPQFGTGSVGADPRRIFTVPAGMPILLRGTKWQETPPSGLFHRSPPIEGSGETRLVLVLDPVSDPEEAF